MSPTLGLPAVNFFIADVGGGMGPFLPTWLAQVEHWSPTRISFILSAALVAGVALSTPAGILIDRVGRPRLMLLATCFAIMAGTLAMFGVRGFGPVLLAQLLVAAGGALAGPALTALTLATVGKAGFPKQQGINQAATHTGNVAAAVLIWGSSFLLGPAASIAVLGLMAGGMLITLAFFPKDAVDPLRMTGCKPQDSHSIWLLLRNRRLIVLTLALGLFNLGNGAMLPMIGQRLAASGMAQDPTQWMAAYVIVAQAVMIPVSWLAGHSAHHLGRRAVLIAACMALAVRGLLTTLSADPLWLALTEVLDGVGAGLISVAGPAAIADLTYGGGRTQTAMGAVATAQSLASMLSFLIGAFLAEHIGWPAAFGGLMLFPLGGVALLFTIHLMDEFPEAHGASAAAAISARV
jgi:MFS family permease